jgi:hypothetical protein
MSADVEFGQVRALVDDAHFESVEQVPDDTAAFNLRLVYSGMPVHVVKPQPGGPLVVGGQVELDEELLSAFRSLSEFDRRQLRARIREQLTPGPALYYFLDETDANVAFENLHHVRIERFVYPDGLTQDALMAAVFAVAKKLFYLQESIAALVENVESRR